jgi:TPR repeat protein
VDTEESLRYYYLAADQGDVYSYFKLGVCYELGDCVDINIQKSLRYYRLAADKGYEDAIKNVARFRRDYPDVYCDELWRRRINAFWLSSELCDQNNIFGAISSDVVRIIVAFL